MTDTLWLIFASIVTGLVCYALRHWNTTRDNPRFRKIGARIVNLVIAFIVVLLCNFFRKDGFFDLVFSTALVYCASSLIEAAIVWLRERFKGASL
jgi:hypothetical protein